MVVIKDQTKIKLKLKEHGNICIWLGYAKNHAAVTYRVLNLKINQRSLIRDVAFLQRSYGEHMSKKAEICIKNNEG